MADTAALHMRHAEVVFLAGYLKTLNEWDARACVRIQQRGRVAGFFAAPPTGTVTFIAVPLSSEGQDHEIVHDRTVSAGRLRDVLGDVSLPPRGFAGRNLKVPDPVVGPLDLLSLPPMSGWQRSESVKAGDLSEPLDLALAEFRRRVPPQDEVDSDVAQRVAQQIWSTPSVGGVPLRAIHTARQLGFLSNDDATVDAATLPGWARLSTPAGQVFASEGSSNLTLKGVVG